jgi:superfamily II DNA or RNA helicase
MLWCFTHSGETHHESSTRPAVISQWVEDNQSRHKLIVTTYNSLQRLVDAEIDVDTIYFDEAHNSVKRNFFLQQSTSLRMQIVASSSLQLVRLL